MKFLYRIALCLIVMMVLALSVTPPAYAQTRIPPPPSRDPSDYADLLQMARDDGRVRVIVRMNVDYQPESNNIQQLATEQTANIHMAQETVITRLSTFNAQQLVTYDVLPFSVLVVDETALLELIAMPEVSGIYLDEVYPQELASASQVIGANTAHANNFTGAGQVIAVLDSGVQSNHPFFGGRVVAEACFSINDPGAGYTGVCPNGQYSQVGAGTAQPCPGNLCDHGTHVAGIAAGSNGSFNNQTFSGIAPGAGIIAVQINSLINNSNVCGIYSPCGAPTLSSILSGMQYVYQVRNQYSIAAVNMSLGSTAESPMICTGVNPPEQDAVNLLYSVNIAVVTGSGNNGNPNGIAAPACQENSISVGATNDNDTVASFSNSASFLDLLAPGVGIVSSVPGSTYGSKDGTSMATPMVSGAIAVLRQADPTATVDEILSALQSTGVMVTDSRNGVVTPRIQLDAAIAALQNDTVPARYPLVINEIRPSGTHAVEIRNLGSVAANLTNWRLFLYGNTGALEKNYTFPNGFTLAAGAYVTLYRGTGTNTATSLFLGNYTSTWSATNSGAVRLTNGSFGIDFARWKTSSIAPGPGTGWTNENPPAPGGSNTLGRDAQSFDLDSGYDFTVQTASLGAVNIVTVPSNDNLANAKSVNSLPFTETLNNRPATEQAGDPSPSCATMVDTVWYRYQPTEVTTIQVDTVGSGIDTALAVFQGTSTLTQVGCNDDIVLGYNPASRVIFTAQPGITYTIMVGTFSGFGGLLQVNIDSAPANDSILGAEIIDVLPYSDTLDNSQMTNEGTDPAPSCNDSTNYSLWYRFTASRNTTIRFSTANSTYDTILSIYTGAPGALTEVACHDDVYFNIFDLANVDLTSKIDLNVTSGVTYYIMISSGTLTELFDDTGTLHFGATDLTPVTGITLFAPASTITDGYGNPIYRWSDTGASNYQLYVQRVGGGQIIDQTVSRSGRCTNGTCQIDLTTLAEANRLTNGAYQWYAREAGGVWSNPLNFVLNASPPTVVTLGTTTGTDGTIPTFHWTLSGVAGNATYFHAYVVPTNNIAVPVLDQWFTRIQTCGSASGTTCSLVSPVQLTNGVQYQAYIQSYGPGGVSIGGSGGYAGPDTFTINVPTPQPISPSGVVNLPLGNPSYTWTDIAGISHYYLYVANAAGTQIVNEVVSDVGYCNGSQCQIDATTLRETYRLPNGAYTFYVRGWKNNQTTPWSAGMSFTVNSTLPGAVTKVAPTNGGAETDYDVSFSWQQTANSFGYNLYLVDPNGGASGVLRGEVGDEVSCSAGQCTWTYPIAHVDGIWTWYIQAFNAAGAGAWSTATTFTVPTAIPSYITKIAPAQGATLNSSNAAFSWGHASVASQYQLYIMGPNGWISDITYTVGQNLTCATNCSVNVVLPLVGSYSYYLRGRSAAGWGAWSAGGAADGYGLTTFTVTDTLPGAITKLSPTNAQNLTDLNVTFSWNADSHATYYQLYVAGPNGFASDQTLMVGTGVTCTSTCQKTLTLPANGAYSWYLRGYSGAGWGAWSAGGAADNYGVRTFTVGQPLPGVITKTAPTANATLTNLNTTFSWQSNANATKYELYITGPNGFASDQVYVVGAGVTCSSTCSLNRALPENGTYTWYVRGGNAVGWGLWNAGQPADYGGVAFTVNMPVPGIVAKSAPAQGSTLTNVDVTFTWTAQSSATKYELYITGPNGFASDQVYVVGAGVTCTSSCSLSRTLPANGAYTWYVRGGNAAGWGKWDAGEPTTYGGVAFTVNMPVPGAATLLTPANDAIIYQTNRPTFTWNTVNTATYYRLLVVNGVGTAIYDQWLTKASVCPSSTCSFRLPNPIGFGSYTWQIQTYNITGVGALSATRAFLSLSFNIQPLMVQGEDGAIVRSGNWTLQLSEGALGQSYLQSSASGADTLAMTFIGTQVDVVYVAGVDYGTFVVEIDGEPVRGINANASGTAFGQIASFTDLVEGEHTLRIIPLGGAPVAIDALVVDGQILTTQPQPIETETPVVIPIQPTENAPIITPTPQPEVTEEVIVVPVQPEVTAEVTPEP